MGRSFALILIALCSVRAEAGTSDLDGLYGRDLKLAVADRWQPQSLPTSEVGTEGSMWQYFRKIDLSPAGGISDIYSLEELEPDSGPDNCAVIGMVSHSILPARWWGIDGAQGAPLSLDLNINRPVMITTADILAEFRFIGPIQTPAADYGSWHTGYYTATGNIEVPVHEPAAGSRGDIARAIFYAITIYPPRDIEAEALHVVDITDYPGIAPVALSTLLQWHREDPVSDDELRRDEAVAGIQGCGNPFVSQPELIEHIWGDLSTTPVGGESDHPDVKPNPIPLRPDYSITDARIDLVSPYVPDDASWSVDGRPASSPLIPAELGKGVHELRYTTTSGERGKLLITIR